MYKLEANLSEYMCALAIDKHSLELVGSIHTTAQNSEIPVKIERPDKRPVSCLEEAPLYALIRAGCQDVNNGLTNP